MTLRNNREEIILTNEQYEYILAVLDELDEIRTTDWEAVKNAATKVSE